MLHSGGDLSRQHLCLFSTNQTGRQVPNLFHFPARRETMTLDDAVIARHTVKAFEGGKTLPHAIFHWLLLTTQP